MTHEFTKSVVRHKMFANDPLIIVDVGVSGGFEKHWHLFGNQKIMYGFEARGVPSMRTAPYEGEYTVFPVALSDKTCERDFYVTAKKHASSFFKPNRGYVERFHGFYNLVIKDTRRLQVRDLNSFSNENNLRPFDFMKLDCEGAELDVLVGTGTWLDSVLGVSVEALYQEWRIGQPTFRDIDKFLNEAGFNLYATTNYSILKTPTKLKTKSVSGSVGQLMWGQFIYIRDIVKNMEKGINYKPNQIIKTACYMDIYNLRDCGHELLKYAAHHNVDFGFNIMPFIPLLS